uniref:Uncharacterized protein n=1 Tax=Spironucleus salmonicida TaxID=348837 RepID=V6M6G4_9EUKA|eukprot:EST48994.1 Hypothetical protein SS50377_10764 [Spironucleus salmonicida]
MTNIFQRKLAIVHVTQLKFGSKQEELFQSLVLQLIQPSLQYVSGYFNLYCSLKKLLQLGHEAGKRWFKQFSRRSNWGTWKGCFQNPKRYMLLKIQRFHLKIYGMENIQQYQMLKLHQNFE